jgi:hypothetical protein
MHTEPTFVEDIKTSFEALISGNQNPFVDMLEEFFKLRPFHRTQYANESTLQAIVEISSKLGPYPCISELDLLVDPSKAFNHGRDGHLDNFIVSMSASAAMELKNVTLHSLGKAIGVDRSFWNELDEFQIHCEERQRSSYYEDSGLTVTEALAHCTRKLSRV